MSSKTKELLCCFALSTLILCLFSSCPHAYTIEDTESTSAKSQSRLDRILDYIDLLHSPSLIRRRLKPEGEKHAIFIRHERVRKHLLVREFYEERSHLPAWSNLHGPLPLARDLIDALYETIPLGPLRPGQYHLMILESLMEKITTMEKKNIVPGPDLIADLDILLTDAFFNFGSHLSRRIPSDGQRDEGRLVRTLVETIDRGKSIESTLIELAREYTTTTAPPPENSLIPSTNLNPLDVLRVRALTRSALESGVSIRGEERKRCGGKAERPIKVLDRCLKRPEEVRRFYKERNYTPAWRDARGPREESYILLRALGDSPREGLRAEDYHVVKIKKALEALVAKNKSARLSVELDLLLTDAFFHYASHLLGERSNLKSVHIQRINEMPKINLVKILTRALKANRLEVALKGLVPSHPEYLMLRNALALYRSIQARGGWEGLNPGDHPLRPGDTGERVAVLRRQLLEREAGVRYEFNETLRNTVMMFQKNHGLDEVGVVGSETVNAFSGTVEDRIDQIKINMERWRWYNRILGDRYIIVNIADFSLQVVEHGQTIMDMKAVVGKRYTKTPVLASEIKYLVLDPFWYAPKSIAEGLIQPPGPKNPMGKVKFIFPNNFSVYMHDTPQKHLFGRSVRTFSHGCVRLSRALTLAEHLLGEMPDWPEDRVHQTLKRRGTRRIDLANPMPVYLLYWTAWVDSKGYVHFRNDHYGRDKKIRVLLNLDVPDNEPQSNSRGSFPLKRL